MFCVDDNNDVVDALRIKLSRDSMFEWRGSLASADDLLEAVLRHCPSIVILDLDMPGKDPLLIASEIAHSCPDTRIVIFSGHVREDLIRRALDAGVWGYASKNDDETELIALLRHVAAGTLWLSPGVRAVYDPG